MTFLQGLFLGIVQGLAEFLPISSSGHLSLFQHLFGLEAESNLFITVMMPRGHPCGGFHRILQGHFKAYKGILPVDKGHMHR